MKNNDKESIINKYFNNDSEIYDYCIMKYKRNESVKNYIDRYPLTSEDELIEFIDDFWEKYL